MTLAVRDLAGGDVLDLLGFHRGERGARAFLARDQGVFLGAEERGGLASPPAASRKPAPRGGPVPHGASSARIAVRVHRRHLLDPCRLQLRRSLGFPSRQASSNPSQPEAPGPSGDGGHDAIG